MKDKAEKNEKANRFEKPAKFWYFVMPYVFTGLAVLFSFLYITVNPNIIAILGVLLMVPCLLIIPISMLKKRKSGDGLGLLFMPLGLLGIFNVLCTIENKKDMTLGIIFGIALFVISALGTFKKTIKYVNLLCCIMMIVAVYCLLAGYMPYCFVDTQKIFVSENMDYVEVENYYLSYFLRDISLLAGYGVFCARINVKYKKIDAEEKQDRKNKNKDKK